MTAAAPRVSVCIPAYNGAEFIGGAIRSVLAQSFADFELVVVDDGSGDATVAVARGFDDPRIRVEVNSRNVGQRANWDRSLDEAGGELFKLLPQDDLLEPDCLRRQADVFDDPANAGVVLVCGARKIIDRAGRAIMTRSFGRTRGRVDGRRAVRACVRAGTNLIGEPGAVLMRTALARDLGRFHDSEFYVLDLDFWCRALLRGDLFVLPDALASFRVAAESASVRTARSQSRDFRRFIDRLAGDGRFGLRAGDCAAGKARATLNNLLRRAIYAGVGLRRNR
jgi:glycosyltransferase involved in cell wall biosynthesis